MICYSTMQIYPFVSLNLLSLLVICFGVAALPLEQIMEEIVFQLIKNN